MSVYDTPIQGHGYTHSDVTAIIPNDAIDNIAGALWIQVGGAGDIVFRRADGTETPAIPFTTNQSYGLASAFVGIQEASTATGILAFWAVGVTPVTQVAP